MQLKKQIINWLQSYYDTNNLNAFVIGVSGGIDSAVTSTLCANTNRKTIVLTMPINQNPDETNRGEKHINWLINKHKNVEKSHIELSNVFEQFKKSTPKNFHTKLSLANLKARIRMCNLYLIASSVNGIVVGTGNKVEDFGVGFFTKYGDGGVDISPIADLMKSEVYKLGSDLGIIEEIMIAAPTDGLWNDDRTDEDQLGVSYESLEWAMNLDDTTQLSEKDKNIIQIYNKHRKMNLHKMNPIPIFKKEKV